MLGDALLRAVRRPHRDGMQLSGPLLRSMVRRQGAHVRERTEAFRLISDMMRSVRADRHNSKLDPVQKLRRSLVTETVSDRPNHLLANVGQTKMALCRLMMSVPSRLRTKLPLYLLGVLVFLQLVEPHQTWMALLVGLSALLGISYLWAREMRDKIQVERSSRGNWIVVGDTLEERFQLHNRSTFPVLWATVSDRSDVPGYEIDRAVSVDARSSTSWRSQGACSKRGVFTLGPWSVSMGDPIGLFQVEVKYPEVRQLLVYPRVMRLPDLDLPRGRAGGTITAINRCARAVGAPSHCATLYPRRQPASCALAQECTEARAHDQGV